MTLFEFFTLLGGVGLFLYSMSLIQNAIQYNRENGSILVRTGFADSYPFVSVLDSGIGIPKFPNSLDYGKRSATGSKSSRAG